MKVREGWGPQTWFNGEFSCPVLFACFCVHDLYKMRSSKRDRGKVHAATRGFAEDCLWPCLISVVEVGLCSVAHGHCPSHLTVSCLLVRQACCSSLHCKTGEEKSLSGERHPPKHLIIKLERSSKMQVSRHCWHAGKTWAAWTTLVSAHLLLCCFPPHFSDPVNFVQIQQERGNVNSEF